MNNNNKNLLNLSKENYHYFDSYKEISKEDDYQYMQLKLLTLKEKKENMNNYEFSVCLVMAHVCTSIAKEGKNGEGLYKPNTNMLLR